MQLQYLRFRAFVFFMRRFSARMRKRRMERFRRLMDVKPDMKILDLGGHPEIWRHIAEPLDITILNLPGEVVRAAPSHHRFRYVEGDACEVRDFADGAFDLVFSNSVIEHVGPVPNQRRFAAQVLRLGKRYWVQTPSRWFPLEAHCGMPFWWFYGDRLRRAVLRRWRPKLPAWTEMVAGTRVLARSDMQALFPDAEILTEYSFGFPKSYVAYRAQAMQPQASVAFGLDPVALGIEQKAPI